MRRASGAMSPEEPGPGSGFESGYLSCPSSPGLPQEEEEEEEEEARLKVDFFRKLGYSWREVEGVLQKHGWQADTNTLLAHLLRQSGGAPALGQEQGKKEKERPRGRQRQQRAKGPQQSPGTSTSSTRKKEIKKKKSSPPGKAPPDGPREEAEEEEKEEADSGPEEEEEEGERGPAGEAPSPGDLRPIVIDGSNVAMSHGDKDVFSCRGILLAVNWFLDRGHMDITVFVPSWRKEHPRPDVPIADQDILFDLEKRKIIVFTPSRRVGGKRVVCYDDRFIVKLAYESDGIVVSNDTYRDLQTERPEWKKFIEERLLMYSFVNDKFMPPDDPLGRHGPSLDNFLRKKPMAPEHKKQQCPYGKKCTYGIKCKFYHPERLNQVQRSVADELRANARLSPTRSAHKEERTSRRPPQGESLAPEGSEKLPLQKTPLAEKRSATRKVRLGDGPPHVPKAASGVPPTGSPSGKKGSGSSGHYWPPDWYQPPPASPCMDSLACVSQDRLDSGLGSLEGQLSEMWPGGPSAPHSHYSHQEPPAAGSYRGPGPSYQHSFGPESSSYHPYQPQGYHQPLSASSASFLAYGQELPSSQAPSPHSFSGYLPADSSMAPVRKYWSEPAYQPAPRACQDLPRAPQVAYGENPPSCPWPAQDRFAEERAKVHVKLCGIFHPHLVDAVMCRFPHLLDPQQLAAEILTYKSQNPRV